MNGYALAFLVFVGVSGLVGVVTFFVTRRSGGRAVERLDNIVGRGGLSARSRDSSADLLVKQALLDVSKTNLLERLTPEFFRVSKMFEQADVKIKPSALFGIAIGLGFVGGLISTILVNV